MNLHSYHQITKTKSVRINEGDEVGPCHHGMARPQVADGGTACSMEGSCGYIE